MLVHVLRSRGRSTASKHTSARTVAHDGEETHGVSGEGEREREKKRKRKSERERGREKGKKEEKVTEETEETREDGTKMSGPRRIDTSKVRKKEKRNAGSLLKTNRSLFLLFSLVSISFSL